MSKTISNNNNNNKNNNNNNASQRRCSVLYDPATSSDRLNEGIAMVNKNKSLKRISIQEG